MYQEINISAKARSIYQFEESFTADFRISRNLARKMNEKRDLVRFPDRAVRASQINALALIEEILRYIIHLYREQKNPELFSDILKRLKSGGRQVENILKEYINEFPPTEVYRRSISAEQYLKGRSKGFSHRHLVLRDLVILRLAAKNPVYSPYQELLEDSGLEKKTAYREVISGLYQFFDAQPLFGPDLQNLLDLLHSPAAASPNSLYGQLEYIKNHWGYLLGDYLLRLLNSMDFIREEEKTRLPFPGPARVYEFGGLEGEEERFSRDREWMPRLVMIAKSALVWLDQLARKYKRRIGRLDEIPDEELDTLSRWGFTGLWLIGIWERSKASKHIKQMCGNPEAEASAYSIRSYRVSGELGGEEALRNLKHRCRQRGIRLASDMVPNHTGLDSSWVLEHPDWFVSLRESPFPSYSFYGPDLSEDGRCGLFLEDHYYNRTDAAVVFKWKNNRTGEERFIYHGNDGTHLPWNDTAQINYLNPEAREEIIQAILRVARDFPIIRFDAAMTLSKKHYQRLWFPEPGSGGDIPSRAEHSMGKNEFNRLIPHEFWREVVDRVAAEIPDTLLLAEAFWMMEGYFVRTLGMHRVYNSAFMNMLKAEENKNYRTLIKNTLEFDPEILKRYVNFMNNPDEETAVAQFGKQDKYFGVCTMMATMPGLPLFGHGQVEGFQEKYGMEYSRAHQDERPDQELVWRHEREIFPLLRKRYLFAGVENFFLYDFYTPGGVVNENVFAYSNRFGGERALVLYHNKYEEARGWIRASSRYMERSGENHKSMRQKVLAEGLSLARGDEYYCIFREHLCGLEFIRHNGALWEEGLYIELAAFQYQVFIDFREIEDNECHHYAELCSSLNGRGVPDIETAVRDIALRPLRESFSAFYNIDLIREVLERAEPDLGDIESRAMRFFQTAREYAETAGYTRYKKSAARDRGPDASQPKRLGENEKAAAREFCLALESVLSFETGEDDIQGAFRSLNIVQVKEELKWAILILRSILSAAGRLIDPEDPFNRSALLIDEWRLVRAIKPVWEQVGVNAHEAARNLLLVKVLLLFQGWLVSPEPQLLRVLENRQVREFLQVNLYEGTWWFNKESFETLLSWFLVLAKLNGAAEKMADPVVGWQRLAEKSEYRLDTFLELLGG